MQGAVLAKLPTALSSYLRYDNVTKMVQGGVHCQDHFFLSSTAK